MSCLPSLGDTVALAVTVMVGLVLSETFGGEWVALVAAVPWLALSVPFVARSLVRLRSSR